MNKIKEILLFIIIIKASKTLLDSFFLSLRYGLKVFEIAILSKNRVYIYHLHHKITQAFKYKVPYTRKRG